MIEGDAGRRKAMKDDARHHTKEIQGDTARLKDKTKRDILGAAPLHLGPQRELVLYPKHFIDIRVPVRLVEGLHFAEPRHENAAASAKHAFQRGPGGVSAEGSTVAQ